MNETDPKVWMAILLFLLVVFGAVFFAMISGFGT